MKTITTHSVSTKQNTLLNTNVLKWYALRNPTAVGIIFYSLPPSPTHNYLFCRFPRLSVIPLLSLAQCTRLLQLSLFIFSPSSSPIPPPCVHICLPSSLLPFSLSLSFSLSLFLSLALPAFNYLSR